MATVTGFTAARMQEIEDSTVVDGEIQGDDLVLITRDETEINAGNVRGPQGIQGLQGDEGDQGIQGNQGIQGLQGLQGVAGPPGEMSMVGNPLELDTPSTPLITDGSTGLVYNNIPVVANHRYGVDIDIIVQWNCINALARWDFWFRLNGVNVERFSVLNPGVTGSELHFPVKGTVFWVPSVTQSTDDIIVWADEVVNGADIEVSGSSTLKRKLWITDYGLV